MALEKFLNSLAGDTGFRTVVCSDNYIINPRENYLNNTFKEFLIDGSFLRFHKEYKIGDVFE